MDPGAPHSFYLLLIWLDTCETNGIVAGVLIDRCAEILIGLVGLKMAVRINTKGRWIRSLFSIATAVISEWLSSLSV